MKERFGSDVPSWLRGIGAWRINKDSIDFKWGYIAFGFGFELTLHKGGYFDRAWAIRIRLGWGCIYLRLPIDSGIESCSSPEYGIAIHNNTLWIYIGGEMDEGWNQCNQKWITFDIPFFTWIRDFHQFMDDDGEWIDGGYENKKNAKHETYDFQYKLRNGDIQQRKATLVRERIQWHRKWFPMFKMMRNSIDVEFDCEVGEESGTWKGGCIGCGFDLMKNETPEMALRRMEESRKF